MKATGKQMSKRRPARNPASAAALSESFHGRGVEEQIEVSEEVLEHDDLAALGVLLKIELKRGQVIEFSTDRGEETFLAANAEGSQLYCVGGDQSIELEPFDVDPTKEYIVLGHVKWVFYATDKQHLGRADKKTGPYKHKLGEESGHMPELIYDSLNQSLLFAGGRYYIPQDMDGGASSGIHD